MWCEAIYAQCPLQINEVMQSNIDCIMDDCNEFPDGWIEFYNNSENCINLRDYRLGIKREASSAWQMPDVEIAPYELTLIYADKENKGCHAPFRLETGKGCALYVFDARGEMMDSLVIAKKQPAPNIAYGRLTEGDEEWGYQYLPTPGTKNCRQLCTEILDAPLFSVAGQVFTEQAEVDLALSMPEGTPQGIEIRYTTDGSEPTQESPLYAGTIHIDHTMTVRAKAYGEGYLSARSATQSYIFLGREMTLPLISITTDDRYLNDSTLGIIVNCHENWRRPINLEYFEAEGCPSALNQLCETRMQGGASRNWEVKSMALYAHKRFGEKRFGYEFFPEQRPGQDNYKSLLLRNAGNDCYYLYIRDALIQRSMASCVDLDWQAWQPAIVYINGKYNGMLNIRERSNADNIYTNYDGLEDIDMVENWTELKEGSIDSFYQFYDFFHESLHSLEEYSQILDIEEFINYMIMEIYYNNMDFPHNNVMQWRPREEGGRWRFVAKDLDITLGMYDNPYTFETFRWYYDPDYSDIYRYNKPEYTIYFRQLMENEDFRRLFLDHMAVYMGDFLNYDHVWPLWSEMYETISTELPYLRELLTQEVHNYDSGTYRAKEWLKNRTDEMYRQMTDYYGLGPEIALSINQDIEHPEQLDDIAITVNGIPLSEPKFDGKYFGGQSIVLTASPVAQEGEDTESDMTGWIIIYDDGTESPKITCQAGETCRFEMPANGAISILSVFGDNLWIETLQYAPNEFYNLMGEKITVSMESKGFWITTHGRKVYLK